MTQEQCTSCGEAVEPSKFSDDLGEYGKVCLTCAARPEMFVVGDRPSTVGDKGDDGTMVSDMLKKAWSKYTVAVIKPGPIQRGSLRQILMDIWGSKFRVRDMVARRWFRRDAERFYEEHVGQPYYDALIEHAISGVSVAMLLEYDDVPRGENPKLAKRGTVERWRQEIGPTVNAPAHTLRGMYGLRYPDDWGGPRPDNGFHGTAFVGPDGEGQAELVEREASILGLKLPTEE